MPDPCQPPLLIIYTDLWSMFSQSDPPASDFDLKYSYRYGDQLSSFAWDCPMLKRKVLQPRRRLSPGQSGMGDHSSRDHTDKRVRTSRNTQAAEPPPEQSWENTEAWSRATAAGWGGDGFCCSLEGKSAKLQDVWLYAQTWTATNVSRACPWKDAI